MPVTERLMKAGDFTLRFANKKGTSLAAYDACRLFDHVVITPTRLHPISGFSDANILAQAIFTGIIKRRPDNRTIGGPGLADWFGTEDGKGDLLDTPVSNTTATLSTWATSLRPASLAAGTVTNTGTSYTGTYQWTTRREAFTHLCRQVGAEWRINPDFTLDAAAPTTLFKSSSATAGVVITRKQQSSEAGLRGVQATEVVAANDVETYVQKVIVVGKNGDSAAVATGSATGSNVYKDGLNNNVVIEQFINAPQEPAANLTAYATAQLALSTARSPIDVDTEMWAIPLTIKPGDYVWVYDPDTGTLNTSNQLQWRGETICPKKLRCQSTTWAITKGMGVYARQSGSTPTYIDLSDAVEYETGGSSFELGGGRFDPLLDPAQQSAAWLGANPEIVNRVPQPMIQFVPSWSGTLGNGTIDGYYTINSGWCSGYISLVWGNTTSHAAAVQVFGTPVTAAIAARLPCGAARLEDNSAGNFARTAWLAGTSSIRLTSEAGVEVTNAVPFTFTTSDSVRISFGFPIA